MKFLYSIFATTLLPLIASAQLIITNPPIPTANQAVTITFDATLGDAGLKGYTGDVYAYTGVTTNVGKWQFVKETSWLDNPASCKMTRIATDQYQLTLSPSIRAFYNVPDSQQILQMCFVFRSADGTYSGRDVGGADIFTNVYTVGLNVSFINPSTSFSLIDNNQKIPIKVNASSNDSICLYLDNIKIKSAVGQTLIDTIIASGSNIHSLEAKAFGGTNIVSDSVQYLVHGNTQYATLPSGLHDGINYINDSTVSFVLFAPYKSYVYLLGDFNNWTPANKYLMNEDTGKITNQLKYRVVHDNAGTAFEDSILMVGDSARFWITLRGLTPKKEYIFQYLIDGNIRIADPYSEKISDTNDQAIAATTYPNLISYPTGKTTGIAGVIQTGQQPYNWQVTSFTPPNKNNLVIYELLIRDFTANKNIKTVTDTLSYLKRLGVNAIELMPFSEFDGNDSWGYNPDFYFAPDKAYGTKEDYKYFIDICHQNGIAVIQDMVLDFSTNNSPLAQMYFANGKPTSQNPWYNVDSPNSSYSYGNVLNHESPYTRALTDSITSFWMKEYKIDGFRFDFAKGWTNTFGEGTPYDQSRITNLKLAADHIWKLNPNAYVILELFTDNSEESVLSNYGMMIWGNINYAYGQAAMGLSTGWDFSGISYKSLGWNDSNLVGYMESHDEEREMYRNENFGNGYGTYSIKNLATGLKRMEMANTFFLTVPGPKMIWQFGEVGYDISINYNGRTSDKPIHWEYYNDAARLHLFNVCKSLIRLKKEEPVFSTNNFTIDAAGSVKHIELLESSTQVEIVGNFDVSNKYFTLIFPATGKWYEFFTGDSINITNTSYGMTLKPGEYRLYANRKMVGFDSIPSISTPVLQITDQKDNVIYPNPFSSTLYLDKLADIRDVEILNMQGQTVLKSNSENLEYINTSGLPAGLYFVTLYFRDGKKEVVKTIKMQQ